MIPFALKILDNSVWVRESSVVKEHLGMVMNLYTVIASRGLFSVLSSFLSGSLELKRMRLRGLGLPWKNSLT